MRELLGSLASSAQGSIMVLVAAGEALCHKLGICLEGWEEPHLLYFGKVDKVS